MGTNNKTEEQMTDALLRNYVKQQRQPDSICREFDPDIANAYLEQVLTSSERVSYESHLSDCSFCRKGIITLAQLAEVEVPLAVAAAGAAKAVALPVLAEESEQSQPELTIVEKLKNWLGILVTPRFAFAAAAIIALAVTIPVILLSNKSANPSSTIATAKQSSEEATKPLSNDSPSASSLQANGTATNKDEEPAVIASYDKPTRPAQEKARPQPESQDESVAGQPSATSGNTVASIAQQPEAKRDAEAKPAAAAENQPKTAEVDQARRDEHPAEKKQEEVAVTAPAAAPSAKRELEKIDPAVTMRSQGADKDNVHGRTIKPGTPADVKSARDTNAVIRSEDNTAPAAPPPPRGSLKSVERGSSRFRESKEKLSERSNVTAIRKIKDKYFWLIDDIWTDREYRKEKELPVVTLIKDSEVYKEVLSKLSGLQRYFSAFNNNDKAIIVYKDTVYKLLPQGDK